MKIRYLTATVLALMLIVPLLNAQDSDAKEKKLSEWEKQLIVAVHDMVGETNGS